MPTIDRRTVLIGFGSAGVASFMPHVALAKPTLKTPSFDFLFLTDSHIEPELDAANGTGLAFRKAKAIRADFAIQGGDHVFDAGAVSKARANSLFDLYGKTEQDLGMKVYHTIGNHDCFGILDTNVSSDDRQYGKKMFEGRFGDTHYSFDHKGCHFIVLDSINPVPGHGFEGWIGEDQLKWLSADLQRISFAQPVIVVTHIPLVTAVGAYISLDSPMRQYLPLLSIKNSAQVLNVLQRHNVIAVLQGHTHINETVIWKGTPFITSGAVCGNWWHGSYLGNPEGFTVVSVVGGKVTTRYETSGFNSVDPKSNFSY